MAGIIKASETIGGRRHVQSAAFNFDDMDQKAAAYVQQVRERAKQILTEARDEADQLRQQAHEQGRQAARKEAENTVQARLDEQLRTLLPALERAVAEIHESKVLWRKHWEQNVVRLAVAIAERVVRRELSRQPDITLDLIREALELAAGSGRITLHISPQDQAALRDRITQLTARLAQLAPADIVADAAIAPGGCRVTTEFGEIDQQIASQLSRIEEELNA